jgi:MoaA/NifB/PqqE/SkfB family radical SAM enzyme
MRLSGPLSVLLEVNSSCQLNCRYCSAAPFDGSFLPKDRAVSLIQELGDFPVWAITLSGGEPLLHPHILTLVEACYQAGISPIINTNGLRLLDRKMLDAWVDLKSKNVEFTFSISIDSCKPADNDWARGRGDSVVSAIHAALQEGLDVTLSTVVHKGNLESALMIPEAFPAARQVRYSQVVCRHLDSTTAADLEVDAENMLSFWYRALALQRQLGEERILLPFRQDFEKDQAPLVQKEHAKCFCGFTSCVIDSHFNIYPCDWARTSHTKMGNVAVSSLRAVWASDAAENMRSLASSTRLCQLK